MLSTSRPVTSAFSLPRSRKIGRSLVKAYAMPPPNTMSRTAVTDVSRQFRIISQVNATMAVMTPPTSWTNPVPTRLRIPSASDITRETS